MWKDDREVLPSSSIRHLTVENLGFVLNLRKDEHNDTIKPKISVTEKKNLDEIKNKLKKTSSEIDESDQPMVKDKPSKETGCKIKKCIAVENEFIETLEEVSGCLSCMVVG
jgi:hypothetical protein